ncbi:MAG: DUF2062 domain-containing protein [Alphaproteobacteria bacterium]|nr:DUF2062 domain-containing protein [Alphaproteobacteria bacterium]
MENIKKYLSKYNKKILVRLKQLKGTPYSVAAGFACGVAISFTPFIGFHLILAAITAWFIRGNIVSSALGTLIGNPWTFPFIWIAVLSTGNFLLGNGNMDNVNFLKIFEKSGEAVMTLNFKNFGHDVWPIIYPMMVGCIPYYIVSWFVSYKLIKSAMDKLEQRRLKRQTLKGNKI